MKVGAFELQEPLPELEEPHAFVSLSPWIDVGKAGNGTLSVLETHLSARELGKLRMPGLFYDFTRYRPVMYFLEGRREVKIPDTIIKYARGQHGHDFLFFHCLEPHMLGEIYADSTLKVLQKLGVRRYCMVGSMYDAVPHTRAILVSGSASEKPLQGQLKKLNIRDSKYEGPTTINVLISQNAEKFKLETMTLIEHLPHYTQLEEDYTGQYALLSLLCRLYDLQIDLREIKRKGDEQYARISIAIKGNPQIAEVIKALELDYDSKVSIKQPPTQEPPLSPEVERFLKQIDQDFRSS